MFDPARVSLGIAPIGWCNDDMPELGAENTFQQIVSEMALAGFTGCEIGNKYPSDPAELKKALDLRGMRIASRWYSSFLLTRPFEEEVKDFCRARVAKEKVPEYVRFVSGFPMNEAGKIQKYKMREEAVELLGLQEAANIETA